MTAPFGFQCHTCGEYHEGMPSFGWDQPLEYWQIPEEERSTRADLSSDACVIDGRWFFVRGCIEIPVHSYEEPFTYGVWVSLSQDSFRVYLDTIEAEGRETTSPFFGWLTAVPPPYPNALLKTRVHLRPFPIRPLIEVEPTDHPLAVDQRAGITLARVQGIAELLLHGN